MLKNAIVIMFDSLQFNYVGAYGNEWIKTPNMDRLAREGVLFENAYTEGLPTVPCRRAMHTGRYTLPKAGWVPLSMEDTTIADLCWGRPIDTAIIFDAGPYRLPKFGYTRGFDKVWFTHGHETDDYFYEHDTLIHYRIDDFVDEKSHQAYTAKYTEEVAQSNLYEVSNYLKQRQYGGGEQDRYVTRTVTKAIEYLDQVDRNKQFFLWIDSFDPHEPWDPPSVYNGEPCPYDPDYKGKSEILPFADVVNGIYTEAQLHHVRMLYAELVTLCDKYLGRLMDAMRRLGLEENTLLLMVSDHGEPMGNGEHGHGIIRKCRPWPYEELAHVPMLLRAPGLPAGKRVTSFVQSCDVAPTVCDWLGIGVHPDMQGKSLLALAKGEVEKVRDFAIAGYYPYSWALYTDEWSFVHWNNDRAAVDSGMTAGQFYTGAIDAEHLKATGGKSLWTEHSDALKNAYKGVDSEVAERQRKSASLDGESQWTCTPSSTADVPEQDELYNRRTDPFQLHNVIDKHPTEARVMLDTLRAFMSELRAS